MAMAAQHLPPMQQLSRRSTVVSTVVFDVRSLAQTKLNHCAQQRFSVIMNVSLILPASLMGQFNSSKKSPDYGTDLHPTSWGCVLLSLKLCTFLM